MLDDREIEKIINKKWDRLSPIERLIVIYLREGKSPDEIKDILSSQLKLVATEVLNKTIEKLERDIISDKFFKDILAKLES